MEHIHLLYINKKIQTEDDYQIFNSKGLLPQYPLSHYIINEENRDYQLSQLSRRLQESPVEALVHLRGPFGCLGEPVRSLWGVFWN